MKTVSIINMKGGTGKSTTTFYLANYLGKNSKKVLVIDFDIQCNLSYSYNYENKHDDSSIYQVIAENKKISDCIKKTSYDNVDIIVASYELKDLAEYIYLKTDIVSPIEIFKKQLQKLDYDYIIIDCPPSVELLGQIPLIVSNEFIVPINPDEYSLEGVLLLYEVAQEIKKSMNSKLKLAGIFLNKFRKLNSNYRVYEELKENLFDDVKNTTILQKEIIKKGVSLDSINSLNVIQRNNIESREVEAMYTKLLLELNYLKGSDLNG